MVGVREPEIYGERSYADLKKYLRALGKKYRDVYKRQKISSARSPRKYTDCWALPAIMSSRRLTREY